MEEARRQDSAAQKQPHADEGWSARSPPLYCLAKQVGQSDAVGEEKDMADDQESKGSPVKGVDRQADRRVESPPRRLINPLAGFAAHAGLR